MMVSHRVQSTVDGFDFNSKLTDSVECSLESSEGWVLALSALLHPLSYFLFQEALCDVCLLLFFIRTPQIYPVLP